MVSSKTIGRSSTKACSYRLSEEAPRGATIAPRQETGWSKQKLRQEAIPRTPSIVSATSLGASSTRTARRSRAPRSAARDAPWQRLDLLSPRHDDAELVALGCSRADGSFALRHRIGDVVQLRVEKKGFASLELSRRVAGERLELTLYRACPLVIQILDAGGRPLPGARIRASRYDGLMHDDLRSVVSGPDGIARIDDLGPGPLSLVAEHQDGHCLFGRITLEPGPVQEITLHVEESALVQGRVVDDESGDVIAGAQIKVGWRNASAKTDAQGRFRCFGVPLQEDLWTSIAAEALGYARCEFDIQSGTEEVELRLKRGQTVRGRIVDEHGAGLAGTRVSLIAYVSDRSARRRRKGTRMDRRATFSDSEGVFVLRNLQAIPRTLVFEHEGFGRQHLDLDAQEGRSLIDIDSITLLPALVLAGRILDGNDEPLRDAKVILSGHNHDRLRLRTPGLGPAQSAYAKEEWRRSDDLGRFRFGGLPAGTFYIHVAPKGRVAQKRMIELKGDDSLDHEFRFTDDDQLTLSIRERGAGPVQGIDVSLDRHDGLLLHRATSDQDGRVSIAGVAHAKHGIRLAMAFRGLFRRPELLIVDGPGNYEIELERRVVVAGRVLGPDGAGAGFVQIRLRQGGEERLVLSGGDGVFSIDAPRPGPVSLELSGLREQQVSERLWVDTISPLRGSVSNIQAPAQGVLLRALRAPMNRSLRILVVDAEGRPLSGAAVYAPPLTTTEPLLTDGGGRLILDELSEIPLRLRVLPPLDRRQGLLESVETTVVAKGQDFTLQLEAARLVTGALSYPGGDAAVGVVVEAWTGGERRYQVRSDEGGRYRLRLPIDGTFELRARSLNGRWRAQAELQNSRSTLDIALVEKD